MSFHIVRIRADAIDSMRELLALFGEVFEDTETYLSKPPSDAYLEDLLAREGFIALAAVDEGGIVGGHAAYELKKFEQGRSEVYIYDLAVAESHRRRGVATALIGETVSIAGDLGAWVVYVQADHGDEAPTALYTKLGVREDVLHFDIPVPDDIPAKKE